MDPSGSPSQSPVLPKRKRAKSARKASVEPLTPALTQLGRYVVTGQLGRGGMGIVYEAEDTLLKRKVAIKLLPGEVSANPEALARFLREAQAAARLNHANVVAVYDIGETDGTHYIVMELMDGGNAQEILRNRGPFHWAEATSILKDVCRGVAAAHVAGLIHRDIKPANILRSTDGIVKLGDFGLVKPAGVKGTGLTALGEVVGTPHYMSPEQSRCDPLDKRSDIYSLGAAYFALLTGRPPFNSPDSMQVLFAHCAHPVPDPRELVGAIPNGCTAIIRKAMRKNRADRYRHAGELLVDLEKLLAENLAKDPESKCDLQLPPFVWSSANSPGSSSPLSLANAYIGERSGGGRGSKRRGIIIGLALLSLALSVALVAVAFGIRNEPTPIPQPEQAPAANADWPSLSAEADGTVRSRNAKAMKGVLEKIRVAQNRTRDHEPVPQDAIRQVLLRLEKALAFRESITEKGLVLGFDGPVSSVLFSPDGRWLAIGQTHGDVGAWVFDSYTGEKQYRVWPRRGNAMVRVQSMAFDRDSAELAAVCPDDTIRVSRFASGLESSFDTGPGVKRALAVAFSPTSNKLVAGSEAFGEGKGNPYLKVWNIDTGKEPFAFKHEHSATVSSVAFTAGGHQVATGSHDKRVVMWNAETGRIWRELRTGLTIQALACSPHGRTIAVAGLDGESSVVQFWDYAAETLQATRPSPHGPSNCVAFSRDGSLLASGSGSRVLLWNAEGQEVLATLVGHGLNVTSVAFSADGSILATGSADQTIRLWDVTRHLPPRIDP